MRRRDFIALVGGAASAWPLVARGEETRKPRRIGMLMIENDPLGRRRVAAFREELRGLGWSEGHNLQIELRWPGTDADRIKEYAVELTKLAPDVIVTYGTTATVAMKQATSSIPIVFASVNDPVGQGIIASLARPGGNITGFSFIDFELFGKLLELLKEVAPKVTHVGLMFRPADHPSYDAKLEAFATDQHILPTTVVRAAIDSDAAVESAIAALAVKPGGGLIVAPDTFTVARRRVIATAAAQHGIPAIYAYRQAMTEGGLMSYAPDTEDIFRRSASYVDRVLKGERPADLPAQAPIKFEFVINLKTAKALGLDVPPNLVLLADEVIE
jgi:putative tryptophan/tyrosine transport system substrate-binding protein